MLEEAFINSVSQAGIGSVRSAYSTEAVRAVAVVALAFSTDPSARWMYRDAVDYLAHFPAFIRAFAGKAFDFGSAVTAPGFEGAALWLPPGVHPNEEALDMLFTETVADEIRSDLYAVFERMAEYHPDEPHWYLPMIGVDTRRQGNGIGASLLKFSLERCDADGLPAYLESSNPRNISLYERFGFERLAVIQAGSSPPIVPMLRKANH